MQRLPITYYFTPYSQTPPAHHLWQSWNISDPGRTLKLTMPSLRPSISFFVTSQILYNIFPTLPRLGQKKDLIKQVFAGY